MTNNQLYSNNQEERLKASKSFNGHSIEKAITEIKKSYWFGSPNAWAIFLGISPGNSAPKGKKDESNYESQISFAETSNQLLNFRDTNGFWDKIREYTQALFPNIAKEDSLKMILTGNLVNAQVGDSRTIKRDDDLRQGAIESFKVISLVKPKVVICLQADVYKLIYEVTKENNHNKIQDDKILEIHSGINSKKGSETAPIYKVPVTFLQSEDELWNKWVLTRVPMHPSRANFCNQDNFKNQFLIPLTSLVNDFLHVKI